MTRHRTLSQKPVEEYRRELLETFRLMQADREERKHRPSLEGLNISDSAQLTEVSPLDRQEMEDIAQEIQWRGGGEEI